MKPRLYIETTIVSYLTARPTRDVIALARQQITQAWWVDRLPDFNPVVSQLVLDEAARGDKGAAEHRLRALEDVPLLDATPAAFRLAAQFIRPGAMPAKAKDDALHLAVCAVHGMAYPICSLGTSAILPMRRCVVFWVESAPGRAMLSPPFAHRTNL